jgi:DNA-binding NtrC family response regulator
LARAAQLKQPGLPVLIVSGYANSAAVEAVLGSARQLRKPFDMAELGAAVAETLQK